LDLERFSWQPISNERKHFRVAATSKMIIHRELRFLEGGFGGENELTNTAGLNM